MIAARLPKLSVLDTIQLLYVGDVRMERQVMQVLLVTPADSSSVTTQCRTDITTAIALVRNATG